MIQVALFLLIVLSAFVLVFTLAYLFTVSGDR